MLLNHDELIKLIGVRRPIADVGHLREQPLQIVRINRVRRSVGLSLRKNEREGEDHGSAFWYWKLPALHRRLDATCHAGISGRVTRNFDLGDPASAADLKLH